MSGLEQGTPVVQRPIRDDIKEHPFHVKSLYMT